MANKKISQLDPGGSLLATDLIPAARGNVNVSIPGSVLLNLGGAVSGAKRGEWNSTPGTDSQVGDLTFNLGGPIPAYTYASNRNPVPMPTIIAQTDPTIQTTAVLATPAGLGGNAVWSMSFPVYGSSSANTLTVNFAQQTEGGYDWFNLYIDDQRVFRQSGAHDYAAQTFVVPNGAHTVKIEYTKDGGVDAGYDGIRFSRISAPVAVYATPYNYGDIITRSGRTYLCLNSKTLPSALPEATPGDWLYIPNDPTSILTDLASQLVQVGDRPPGLPYAYSGPKKYRYWRIGIAGTAENVTRMYDVSLRPAAGAAMPAIAVKGQAWPEEWTDADITTQGGIATFGNLVFNDFDFGTPILGKVLTILSPQDMVDHVVSVFVSEDNETWTQIANRAFFPGAPPNTLRSINLVVPQFVGYTGYNLTANPQTNIGNTLKVNSDGSGFDFAAPLTGMSFSGTDYTLAASPATNTGKYLKVATNGTSFDFGTPLSGLPYNGVDYNLTADPTTNQGKLLAVNATGTGIELVPVPSSGGGGGSGLDFTPVQQGGGIGQQNNKVYIGWDGSKLRATVDNSDLGAFTFGGSTGGSSGSGGSVNLVNARKDTSSIGPDETEINSITITPRAGSTLDIHLGRSYSYPDRITTGNLGSKTEIQYKVYRNGVLLSDGIGQYVERNSGTSPVTYRVTAQYAVFTNGPTFDRYDTYTPSVPIQSYFKITEYP